MFFRKTKPSEKPRRLIIVAGAESTGTRVFTEIFSQHPQIRGSEQASNHNDILDDLWQKIASSQASVLAEFEKINSDIILTRRSYPHGGYKKAAQYMKFPPLQTLLNKCKEENIEATVLVTTRSPLANLSSWTEKRASASKQKERALNQYQRSYFEIINACIETNTIYYILSLEAVALEGNGYINSIFKLLNLPGHQCIITPKEDFNSKWY